MLMASKKFVLSEDPPPCPWCGSAPISELGLVVTSTLIRYFHCAGCGRTFRLEVVPLDEPPSANGEDSD